MYDGGYTDEEVLWMFNDLLRSPREARLAMDEFQRLMSGQITGKSPNGETLYSPQDIKKLIVLR